MNAINYESEINQLLQSSLLDKYSLRDESVFVRYFLLRYMLSQGIKIIHPNESQRAMCHFLLDELNLPHQFGNLTYKKTALPIVHSSGQSIDNILTDWLFRASLWDIVDENGKEECLWDYLKRAVSELRKHGSSKARTFRGDNRYGLMVKKYALEELNRRFGAKVTTVDKVPGFLYPEDHNYFKRDLEEVYDSEAHALQFIRRDTRTISEEDLEKYLLHHLNLIEDGLVYMGSQVSIENGRIDILAKDRNNVYVIIELKINDDKELLWQCLFYPMQFKKTEKVDRVRMITLTPQYPDYLLEPLKKLGYVETFAYTPVVESGAIKSMKVYPVH